MRLFFGFSGSLGRLAFLFAFVASFPLALAVGILAAIAAHFAYLLPEADPKGAFLQTANLGMLLALAYMQAALAAKRGRDAGSGPWICVLLPLPVLAIGAAFLADSNEGVVIAFCVYVCLWPTYFLSPSQRPSSGARGLSAGQPAGPGTAPSPSQSPSAPVFRRSRLVSGQQDLGNPLGMALDRFHLVLFGGVFALCLFEGPRLFLVLGVLLALEPLRWRVSPVYTLYRDRSGQIAAPRPGRIVTLVPPALLLLAAGLWGCLVFFGADDPARAGQLSRWAEVINSVFNGEALRHAVSADGGEPGTALALSAHALLAAAAFATVVMIEVRGGILISGSFRRIDADAARVRAERRYDPSPRRRLLSLAIALGLPAGVVWLLLSRSGMDEMRLILLVPAACVFPAFYLQLLLSWRIWWGGLAEAPAAPIAHAGQSLPAAGG